MECVFFWVTQSDDLRARGRLRPIKTDLSSDEVSDFVVPAGTGEIQHKQKLMKMDATY